MTFFGVDEGTLRLSVFAFIFIVMAVAEALFPKKKRSQKRPRRWFTNWALVIIDTVALRIFVPVLAVSMAVYADARGWGLLAIVELPFWIEIMVAIIILDLAVYAQHVVSHKVPVLWRLHQVHHIDRDIDVTTGARFHPLEIILSMMFKLLCVCLLGPAAMAVFLFEVILNASAMFNHSNVKLPLRVDKIIRLLIVTPDMHRVHHSIKRIETDSNYGFFLSLWDRVFHTYIAQPELGHDGMVIGLEEHQTESPSSLLWSLLLPFRSKVAQKSSAK